MSERRPLPAAAVSALRDEGLALHRHGRTREALAVAQRGLALAPDAPDLLNNAGVFAAALGDSAGAETFYRRAIAARPDAADAHRNLGNLLHRLGRLAEAEAAYRRAIEIKPDQAGILVNLGNVLKVQGRTAEAEAIYRRAIEIKPDFAGAWGNLGILLKEGNRPSEAEAAYRRAIEITPDFADGHNHLGILLAEQGRDAEAEAAYRCALRIKPNLAGAQVNLGVLLERGKRFAAAEAAYRGALAIAPGLADARFNLGLLQLRLGQDVAGWEGYEARHGLDHRSADAPPPTPDAGLPPWRGEPIAGKSLLIWLEQGFGDEIQFVRFLAPLRSAGAAGITLVCKPALKSLFAAQGLADRVLGADEWRPALAAGHDFWCHLLSLPRYLKVRQADIPRQPYLTAEAARVADWTRRLPVAPYRVGLLWQGAAINRTLAHRALPSLEALAPLWSESGIAFVSLQKGAGESDVGRFADRQPLTHLGGTVRDFADTAAIVSQLDLIITVDSALAHLAGAMGKACWVLLAHHADWRWLEKRSDSPWYPDTMRLFRQPAPGDWTSVVSQVGGALRQWRAERAADMRRK